MPLFNTIPTTYRPCDHENGLVKRENPTPDAAWCGFWWDCPTCCFSMLIPSPALIQSWVEQGYQIPHPEEAQLTEQPLETTIFILGSGPKVIPGNEVCSQCSFSRHGEFPGLRRVAPDDADKGQPGDWIPLCAKSSMSTVAHWQGHRGIHFPKELNPLRLFKCRAWFWVIVPGLRDDCPQHLLPAEPGLYHAYYRREATYREDPNLTPANLLETHLFVREIHADSLEAAYQALQGCNWSPNGEARELIASLGLTHTSMSIGDVLAAADGLYEVAEHGFRKLTATPEVAQTQD